MECRSPGPGFNYWRDDGWLHRQQTHRRHESAVGHRGSYDVVLSNSRGPQNLKDLVEELGRRRGRPRRPAPRQRVTWWW